MTLRQTSAELVGTFIEAVLVGINFTVFLDCLRVLRRRDVTSWSSIYLLGTAVLLFVFVIMHLVVDINRNMDAFTTHSDIENYADKYYARFAAFQDIFKSAIYTSATVLADAFIVYRCFVVWGKSYVAVTIPFLLFLADIAIGILWTFTVSQVPEGGNIFTDDLATRIRVFYVITMALNITCTAMISFRIWQIQANLTRFSSRYHSQLGRIIPIIVESGAMYSALLIVLIVLWATSSPVMFVFLNPTCPVIGIVFSTVITRVGAGISYGDEHSTTQSSSRSRIGIHHTPIRKDMHEGVQVNLHRVVHIDRAHRDQKIEETDQFGSAV